MRTQRETTERNVVEYKIVYGGTPELLAQNVSDEIDYGWQPVGGVSVVKGDRNGKLEFYQAVVMTEG